MEYINLEFLGFTESRMQQAKDAGMGRCYPARVIEQHRTIYKVMGEKGAFLAEVSGKLNHILQYNQDYPVVGDWVLVDRQAGQAGNGIIHDMLPRTSLLKRKSAGATADSQALAANVDTVFICMSLNHDFNLRRAERYVTMVWDSGALPVIVLTKSDLSTETQQRLAALETIAMGVDIIVTSAVTGEGYGRVKGYLEGYQTVALIGSSGVGKSTLINFLMGEEILKTSGIREDDSRGRHTTTHRQLIVLPQGGIVIDTPGMRELQLDSGDIGKSFEDIEALFAGCRFADCTHGREPGCAVQLALAQGSLSSERYNSYLKLKKELRYQDKRARYLEKMREKKSSIPKKPDRRVRDAGDG